jgi:hypothetical protein
MLLAELKKDVRNAHFHLGNNNPDYITTGAQDLKAHQIGNTYEQDRTRKEQTDNMRKANFKLPNEKTLATG